MKHYVINEHDLKQLIYDSLLLNELHNNGVDNWHHYQVPEELDEQTESELEGYEVHG